MNLEHQSAISQVSFNF